MMKPYLLSLLMISNVVCFAQAKKKALLPMVCFDYVRQNSNNFGFSGGPALRFQRHTYIGILGGINLLYTNRSSYVSPVIFADYFYQPKRSLVGPVCRFGYTSYHVYGQKDQYLTGDVGIRIVWLCIMGGYNFNIDKKDISDISTYRVTLRVP